MDKKTLFPKEITMDYYELPMLLECTSSTDSVFNNYPPIVTSKRLPKTTKALPRLRSNNLS